MAARPFNSDSAGDRAGLVRGSFPAAASAAVRPVPGRGQIKRWMFAAIRRKSIFRLVANRRLRGAEIDLFSIMFVVGDCLADLAGSPVPPFSNPHLGLHPITVRQSASDLGFTVSDAEIANIIDMVTAHQCCGGNLSFREAGIVLGLTRIEREGSRAWTMDAIDEPAEERRARKANEKRQRDRDNAKAKRAAERERKGLPPYDPKKTLKATAPWKALGIGRTTYYERVKGSTDGRTKSSRTYSPDTCPRRVCPEPPVAVVSGERIPPRHAVYDWAVAALRAARTPVPAESLNDPKVISLAKVVAAHAAAHRIAAVIIRNVA